MGAQTSCDQIFDDEAGEEVEDLDRLGELARLREENEALRAENAALRDSSKFLDDVTEQVWPYVSSFVTNAIISSVEPALQEALPAYLRGVEFDRERCSLGSKSCRFKRVSANMAPGRSDGKENLVLRLSPEWEGDEATMALRFKGYRLGIRSLKARGVLIVELLDVQATLPNVFSGVRLFFESPPEVYFDFQGISKVLNIGVLKSKLLSVVSDQIRALLVLPSRFGVAFGPHVDVFDVGRPLPEGVLWLSAGMAGSVPARAAFLRVDIGASSFSSPPGWLASATGRRPDEEWTLPLVVASTAHQVVSIGLYGPGDERLGGALVPVADAVGWGRRPAAVQFTDSGEQGNLPKTCGTLVLSSEWKALAGQGAPEGPLLQSWELPAPAAAAAGPRALAMCFVGVYSAGGVPPEPERGTVHWVALRCTALLGGCSTGSPPVPVVPAETSGRETWRAPGRRSGRASGELDNEARRSLAEKLRLLQRYRISDADLREVLEVDQEALRVCRASGGGPAQGAPPSSPGGGGGAEGDTLSLQWDQGFEYFLADPRSAVLTLDLQRQAPSAKAPESLGQHELRVAELLAAPRRSVVRTVPLGTAGASLRLRLQLAFFGAAPA